MDPSHDQAPAAPEPTERQSPQLVSRRRLLRILAAGGGAVVASALLPNTWGTPAVKALPPLPMVLTGLQVACGKRASFAYNDPEAEVDDDHTYLTTWIDNSSDGSKLLRARAAAGLVRTGNAQNGTIGFPLWTIGNLSPHQLCVQMRIGNSSHGRYSGLLCRPFTDSDIEACAATPAAAPPCTRADVSAIIYGGWNGILVNASVGGAP